MLYARALFAAVIVAIVGASFFIPDGPLPPLGIPMLSPDPEETIEAEAASEVPSELELPEEEPTEADDAPLEETVVCPAAPPELDPVTVETELLPDTQTRRLIVKAVQAQTDFASDLYRQLASTAEGGNLFFSPHSVGTILTLTADGARNRTAKEMLQVLRLAAEIDGTGSANLNEVQSALAALQKQLIGRNDRTELSVANALWIDNGMPLRKAFLDGVQLVDPKAAFENIDFRNDFEAGRLQINDWTEKNTDGHIQELLAPGILDPQTRLVLTNAVYFRGDWAEPFDSSWNRRANFTLADGRQIKTPLMTGTVHAGFAELDGFSLLDLPYAGETLSLLVVLPDEADGLPAIERQLNSTWLARSVLSLRRRSVHVALPKFRLATKYSLKKALSELGMPTAFGVDADLTGLSDSPEASRLFISAVEHQAFVEVNEKGSEAAAATAVTVAVRGPAPAPAPAHFVANRPFVFAIRHRESGQLLFLGRFTQPVPGR